MGQHLAGQLRKICLLQLPIAVAQELWWMSAEKHECETQLGLPHSG